MIAYWEAVQQMSGRFDGLEFLHVHSDDNAVAHILAKIGARRDPVPENIFLEWLFKPSNKLQVDQEPASEAGHSEPGHTETRGSDPGSTETGASEVEVTSSAQDIMAVILAYTEPILAYLLLHELPED